MKIFLKILIVLLVALCLFPVRVFVYQSLWTYFSVTLGSATLFVIFGKTENAEFLANEILEIFPKTVSFESTFYKSEAMKVLGKHKM